MSVPSGSSPTPPAPSLANISLVEPADKTGLSLHSRSLMVALSHLIEEHAAAAGGETTLVATFQGLSRFRREAARYGALASRLAGVYVVGVPDGEPVAVEGVVALPIEADWPLAQEWVVLASGPSFCAGLIARDEERYLPGRLSHQFYGRWTTDTAAVDGRLATFFQAIGLRVPTPRHDPRAVFQSSRALRNELNQRLKR